MPHLPGCVPPRVVLEGEHLHDLALTRHGATGHATGHDFGHRRQVRDDTVALLRPTGRPAETGDHLVEDQDDPILRREVARGLEIAFYQRNSCPRAAAWLQDEGGDVA